MKRSIKPFTVEVRNGGRKSVASKTAGLMWPEFGEQPNVKWPEITDVDPEGSAGLVSPASSSPVERYLDPRKPPPPRAQPTAEPAATGRVLPVIEPTPEPRTTTAEDLGKAPRAKPAPRRKPADPVVTPEPASVPLVEALPSAIDAKAVAATLVLRQGRDRLTRDNFERGERWKARLPMSVHRANRKVPLR